MAILETYETEDQIPEGLREDFEKREDGTFILKLVGGLKSALDKERGYAKTAKDALKAAEAETETKIQSAVSAREAELKAEASQTESDELKKARDATSKAKRETAATTALQKAGGNITLLLDKVTAKLSIDDKGNPIVVGADGTPLLDDEGNAMSVDGLVASLKANDEFTAAFKGTGNTGGGALPDGGSGSAPANGGGTNNAPSRRSKMTPRQKVDFINEHGDPAYQDLPY